MGKKKIFLSATNGPGTAYTVRGFKEHGFIVLGGDANPNALGRRVCDAFFELPWQSEDDYFDRVLEIVACHEIDYFVPFGERECLEASRIRSQFADLGCTLVAANTKTIETAIDKARLYRFLKCNTDVPVMRHEVVFSLDDFDRALDKMGRKRLCLKPASGSGSRGFVILADQLDAHDVFVGKQHFQRMTASMVRDVLASSVEIPKLLMMEYLEDVHFDTNLVCRDGEVLFQSVKTREEARLGTITQGKVVRNTKLEVINRKIARALNTTGLVSTQFIGDTLVEINPRWSTSLKYGSFDEYLMSLAVSAGEPIPNLDASSYEEYIGVQMLRYWDVAVFKRPVSDAAA